ncbi:MAG: NUDIX hydrolase [Simkaniaceae bacterium]|nr:NUDIX hydrolase [Simkaniaceae bacterium]
MYSHLKEEAKKAGIQKIRVAAIVRQKNRILLLEKGGSAEYEIPTTYVKEGETIQQALQRGLIEEARLDIKDVVAYLGHYDQGKTRDYYFVVLVHNPSSAQAIRHSACAWVDIGEAVGYPISDHLRQTLDLFAKLVS